MKTKLFEIGTVVATPEVSHDLTYGFLKRSFAMSCIHRHQICDWGDVNMADKVSNNKAVEEGGRVLSSYKLNNPELEERGGVKELWVITEADRSSTCLLYPNEY